MDSKVIPKLSAGLTVLVLATSNVQAADTSLEEDTENFLHDSKHWDDCINNKLENCLSKASELRRRWQCKPVPIGPLDGDTTLADCWDTRAALSVLAGEMRIALEEHSNCMNANSQTNPRCPLYNKALLNHDRILKVPSEIEPHIKKGMWSISYSGKTEKWITELHLPHGKFSALSNAEIERALSQLNANSRLFALAEGRGLSPVPSKTVDTEWLNELASPQSAFADFRACTRELRKVADVEGEEVNVNNLCSIRLILVGAEEASIEALLDRSESTLQTEGGDVPVPSEQ
jgi:hypothetical protein